MEAQKPSVDPKGFSLFALQDIQPNRLITLYLGEQYNAVEGRTGQKYATLTLCFLMYCTMTIKVGIQIKGGRRMLLQGLIQRND